MLELNQRHYNRLLQAYSDWPEFPKKVAESMSHPFLGFIGALAARKFYDASTKIKLKYQMFCYATIANFSTELIQYHMPDSSKEFNFTLPENLPETGKDYAFALTGLGLFMFMERQKQN